MPSKQNKIIQTTRNWIESFVIGFNLCPFAKRELREERLRLQVSEADNTRDLQLAIEKEISYLINNPNTETSLLIHPDVLCDFREYNDFLDNVDGLIESMRQDGLIQVASFHPQYQFAETDFDDAENFTNRSPYPMLHFLREASVSRAVDQHPDSALIPQENIVRLRKIGKTELQNLFQRCFSNN